MFLFYHSDQKENSINYHKGILFESLLKNYLEASGYEVDIRRKHNSLEYDIEGKDRATLLQIVGEAKAHKTSISGQDFAAFVGKLLPLGITQNKIKGLFLSTAALTPEADEYYRSIASFGVVAHTGKDLLNSVRLALRLPEFEPLAKQLREKNYRPQQYHILMTDHGIFIAISAGSSASATPAHFAVFQENGQLLLDKIYLVKLAEAVPELKALNPIIVPDYSMHNKERIIPKGLTVGGDWTDYRLPAAPQFFIGRREFIQRLREHIEESGSPNVIQIKSRSGVGKSSILAYLENELSKHNVLTELHDARDVRSILDIYSLIQRFTGAATTPQDFRDVEEQLDFLVNNIGQNQEVFMVDQFESTFINPEVFQSYESLATLFLKFTPSLFICFARKNDQITTYDDS